MLSRMSLPGIGMVALVAMASCASMFLNGGRFTDGSEQNRIIAKYKVTTCVSTVDGSPIQGTTGAEYWLINDKKGLAVVEMDSTGQGTVITNTWQEPDGNHFFTWVTQSGWEYVIPTNPSEKGARIVYTGVATGKVGGVTKPVSAPGARCDLVPAAAAGASPPSPAPAESASATPPPSTSATPPVSDGSCFPECRRGYACSGGQCVKAAAAAAPSCVVSKEATALSTEVLASVPPYFLPLSRGRLVVGVAKTQKIGLGLEIDAATLAAREAFTSPSGKKIIGVVPVGSHFVVDREGGKLREAHTLEDDAVIGFKGKSYSRLVGGNVEEIWPDVKNEDATEARVVGVGGIAYALTFRTAGQVRVGWLAAGGAKKTELGTVVTEGKVGAPTIAANDQAILVAFSMRASDDAAWTVALARAMHGATPERATPFVLPGGGPGGDAIAPSVAGLSSGRWILQWTEGPSGKRVVRVQLLDDKLAKVGEALTVSPAGKEAGQGAIAVSGDRVLSLSLVRTESSFELWGTAVSCN